MNYETMKRPLKSELEDRLSEATALLETAPFHPGERGREWDKRRDAFLSRAPAQPAAHAPVQVECTMCHRPAVCFGSYESNTAWGYSCNECCGHGNEDGRCFPLADIPDHYLALAKRLNELEDMQPAAPAHDYNTCSDEQAEEMRRADLRRQPVSLEPSEENYQARVTGTAVRRMQDASADATRYLLRAEAAEAKLAAVRYELDCYAEFGSSEYIFRARRFLTPAGPNGGTT